MNPTLITLFGNNGSSVTLSSLGAGIVSVRVPDRDGNLDEVLLGYPNPNDYLADGPCAGKVPGRYANRIALGHFTLDGKEFTLAVNNGPNHLHGGPTGFQNRIWEIKHVDDHSVTFAYDSADGEEGYPGNLHAEATYTWDGHDLKLHLTATTDQATVVNLTNHAYWNLDGDGSGTALHHKLHLNASRYLPTNPTLIPLGPADDVHGTPMDFTAAKEVGRDIEQDFPALKYGKGYDNCWLIDDWQKDGKLRLAAELWGVKSGRKLEVLTTQPAVQVYTGNWLEGCPKGHCGRSYHDYEGVAIECQGVPDAPNQPQFPSQALQPGETYSHDIIFRLTAE